MRDTDKFKQHLREHMTFPATKQQILESCENLSQDNFSEEDKKWLIDNLPEGEYSSAEGRNKIQVHDQKPGV